MPLETRPASIRRVFPELQHVFADGAYRGPKLTQALRLLGSWAIEIVSKSPRTVHRRASDRSQHRIGPTMTGHGWLMSTAKRYSRRARSSCRRGSKNTMRTSQ